MCSEDFRQNRCCMLPVNQLEPVNFTSTFKVQSGICSKMNDIKLLQTSFSGRSVDGHQNLTGEEFGAYSVQRLYFGFEFGLQLLYVMGDKKECCPAIIPGIYIQTPAPGCSSEGGIGCTALLDLGFWGCLLGVREEETACWMLLKLGWKTMCTASGEGQRHTKLVSSV